MPFTLLRFVVPTVQTGNRSVRSHPSRSAYLSRFKVAVVGIPPFLHAPISPPLSAQYTFWAGAPGSYVRRLGMLMSKRIKWWRGRSYWPVQRLGSGYAGQDSWLARQISSNSWGKMRRLELESEKQGWTEPLARSIGLAVEISQPFFSGRGTHG